MLADFDSYVAKQAEVEKAYEDSAAWAKMCILNVAASGKFSTDRTMKEYARDIWGIAPCPVKD